jgi:hypothetical protein
MGQVNRPAVALNQLVGQRGGAAAGFEGDAGRRAVAGDVRDDPTGIRG